MIRNRLNLNGQIIVGMFLGVACGIFFGEATIVFNGLAQTFITLLKIAVLPYLIISLVNGIGRIPFANFKKLAKRSFLFLLLFYSLTIALTYITAFSFSFLEHPAYTQKMEHENEPFHPLNIFTSINFFKILLRDPIPAIVLLSLLFGIALTQLRSKGSLLDALDNIAAALMRIIQWIGKLSPIGVFALSASIAGTLSLHNWEKTWPYITAYLSSSIILTFLVFPGILLSLTSTSYKKFMKELSFPLLLAFALGNIFVVLPFIIVSLRNLSVERKIAPKEAKNAMETMIPILYHFPTIGNLLSIIFVLFLSPFYSQHFAFSDHIKLVYSSFFAFFFSATTSVNALSFLLDKMHLPQTGLSLYIETMPFLRHFQCMLTVSALSAITLLAHFSCQRLLLFKPQKCIRMFSLFFLMLIAIYLGKKDTTNLMLHTTNKRLNALANLEIKEKAKSIVYREELSEKKNIDRKEALNQIRETKILKIGYNNKTTPFAYFNKQGDLIGFDAAIAHKLAQEIDCNIEFVPFKEENLSEDLDRGKFDMAISGISVDENKLKKMLLTEAYVREEKILLVKNDQGKNYSDANQIRSIEGPKIAVLKNSAFEEAKAIFPKAEIFLLNTYNDLLSLEKIDALFCTEEEGSDWSKTYPEFTIIKASPSLGKTHYAYAISQNSPELLKFVNYWLDLKKLDEFLEEQYQYWILGKTPIKESRWSIIKNVLHWKG